MMHNNASQTSTNIIEVRDDVIIIECNMLHDETDPGADHRAALAIYLSRRNKKENN